MSNPSFLYIEKKDVYQLMGTDGLLIPVNGDIAIKYDSINMIRPGKDPGNLILSLANGYRLVLKNHGTVLDLMKKYLK